MKKIVLVMGLLLLASLQAFSEEKTLVCVADSGSQTKFTVNSDNHTVQSATASASNVSLGNDVISFTLELAGVAYAHSYEKKSGIMSVAYPDKTRVDKFKCSYGL